jgi:CRISPR-associated protein Csm3
MAATGFTAKLDGFRVLRGILSCETGLRIGASKEVAGPGEMDNPILRHPVTRLPYVPGSSLKGKLRSLLELQYSPRTQSSGRPCDCAEYYRCIVCRLFGCGNPVKSQQPTRLVFRDCGLTGASEKALRDAMESGGVFFSEVKSEIAMDRRTGTTQRGSLRQMERVPAGTEFKFEVVMRVFSGDDVAAHMKAVHEALDMLERDYLGGSGTRGCGKVKIKDRKVEDAGRGTG